MGQRRKRQTFAVIAAEARLAPARPRKGRRSMRPGRFNGDHELFDPDGHLVEVLGSIEPEAALRHLQSGALVAHEVCGCGGYAGCQPDWYDARERRAMSTSGFRSGRSKETPTWIELCRAGDRTVLFLHGDVVWGTGRP